MFLHSQFLVSVNIPEQLDAPCNAPLAIARALPVCI